MKIQVNKYWFYLEPYTFLFEGNEGFVIYNTLNSAYIECSTKSLIYSIMVELNKAQNGYCVLLDGKMLDNSDFYSFIQEVRSSFSGDIIECIKEDHNPFLFKPILFLNSDIRSKKEKDFSFLGNRIMQNLNEITVHLPVHCSNCRSKDCSQYCNQMIHCSQFVGNTLTEMEYLQLFEKISISGINRLNIVGGNMWENSSTLSMLSRIGTYELSKKVFYIRHNQISFETVDELLSLQFEIIMIIHSNEIGSQLLDEFSRIGDVAVKWMFVITKKEDIDKLEELGIIDSDNVILRPYFDGTNLAFFEEFVFYNLSDVIAFPIDKLSIFRRQVLNENFFGQLTITSVGNVFANMNFPALGNIREGTLKEFVYKELCSSKSWLKIRDNEPCSTCVNKWLCPSISNYELVIGKDNLCTEKCI